MAINPESQYPGKIAPSSSDYPYGQARNITIPGDGTGTPWEAALVNDLFGFQQALLSRAGIVPSGTPDKVGASQYLQALESITSKVFASVALMKASTVLQAGDVVRTLEHTAAAGYPGGNIFLARAVTGATGDDASIVKSTGVPTIELVGLFPGGFVTPLQFAGDGDAAALFAFDNNYRLVLFAGESAMLSCDPTGGDDIQAMANWLRQCLKAPDADLYIELADGFHTVSTYIDIIGQGVDVDIRGTDTPDLLTITDVAFSAVAGTLYECNVTVSSALPSQVVVGFPVGMQQVKGDNDAALACGGQKVKAIAGDRLSFTFDFDSPRAGAPTDPTALDNTLEYSLPANQLVVPKGAIKAQSTGWDGSAREGFINCIHGGTATLRNFGIVYDGATDEHDLIFARDTGSRVWFYDRMVLAGAGDKVLRQYGASEMYVNRSCVGGAGVAQEIWQGTAGSKAQFVRSSCGGATAGGLTAGSGTFCSFAQAQLTGSINLLRAVGAGSSIAFQTARLVGGTRGFYAQPGDIYTTSAEIERCTTGIDWTAGGRIVGDVTFGAGSQANTTDSQEPGNIAFSGGGWFQDVTKNLYDPGARISMATNTVVESSLSGTGGSIKAVCETLPQLGFEIDIDLVAPGTIYVARYAGTEIVQDTVDLPAQALPYNAGKVTISVYNDGGTYKLQILNEDGATRAFRFYAYGDIAFGDFVVA